MVPSKPGIQALAVDIFGLVFGVIVIYGTAKRWPRLVDPPRNVWGNSQSMMLKLLGERGLILWNYCVGVLIVVVCLAILLDLVGQR